MCILEIETGVGQLTPEAAPPKSDRPERRWVAAADLRVAFGVGALGRLRNGCWL